MEKKLYVGGMPYSTTEEELGALFANIGEVISVAIIMDRMSGKSKGFGFVEMATEELAEKAISELHNSMLGERKLTVNEAKPMEKRSNDRRGGGYNKSDDRRGGGGGGRSNRY